MFQWFSFTNVNESQTKQHLANPTCYPNLMFLNPKELLSKNCVLECKWHTTKEAELLSFKKYHEIDIMLVNETFSRPGDASKMHNY